MNVSLWAWGVAARAITCLRPAALRRRDQAPAVAPASPDPQEPADGSGRAAEAPWFTDEERDQIGALKDWWGTADDDTRAFGADLADCLLTELPDVPAPVMTRVLMSAARRLEEMACVQDSDYSALRATADAMFGAPFVLAETGMALAGIDAKHADLTRERS